MNVEGQKIILTTVPPIPRIVESPEQLTSWGHVNAAIKAIESSK